MGLFKKKSVLEKTGEDLGKIMLRMKELAEKMLQYENRIETTQQSMQTSEEIIKDIEQNFFKPQAEHVREHVRIQMQEWNQRERQTYELFKKGIVTRNTKAINASEANRYARSKLNIAESQYREKVKQYNNALHDLEASPHQIKRMRRIVEECRYEYNELLQKKEKLEKEFKNLRKQSA